MKKTVTFFAALMLVALAVPHSALAYDFTAVAPSGQTLYYNIVDGNAQVTNQNDDYPCYNSYPTGDLVIPTSVTYNGNTYSVTRIGNSAFSSCSGLTSVTIPISVTSIGKSAFYGCSGLTSVTIPNSVTSIGKTAFSGCSGLTSVVFNADSCTISTSSSSGLPFSGCSNISSFTFGDSVRYIPAFICYGLTGLTSVTIGESVTSIGDYAFRNCSGLTSVTIGESVTSIGALAFRNCSELTSVVFNADSCADLSSNTFYGCSNISSFTFGDNVRHIPANLCSGLTGLTSVTIPNSVTSIGNSAFSSCSGLTSVVFNSYSCAIPTSSSYRPFSGCSNISSFTFGDSVRYIPAYICYGLTGLTSVTIGESVTSIGNSAFYECTGLTSVTIPESVTIIGGYTFGSCSGLTSVVFNADSCTAPTSYSDRPFYGCNNISSFTFGDSVRYIPAYICYGLTGLTSVTIGESVTSIGYSAFEYCSGLTSVTIPNSVTSIGNYTFYNCSGLTSVTIPEAVTIIGYGAFYGCSGLTSVTIGESVTSIGNYAFRNCSGLTSVVFNADSCTAPTSYSDRPFYGCDNISSFTFGNSVRYIPAFICYNMTGLTSVTIGSSVTGIGESAFYGCSGLTSVTIGESVTSIGNYAFYNCSGLTTVTIPNSVTSMGREAFRNCSGLIEVTIPAQVTSIEQGAFANCTALTTVNYHPSDCEYLYDGEMELDKALFAGDTNITTLNIGSNVRRIPALSFTTIGIDTLVLHDSVLYIGQHAFSFCRNLHSVTIGRYTDTIMQAFAWDTALQTINFNADSCRYMGYMHDNFVTSSFGAVDSSVMTINFGSHVKSIPNYAFQSMPKLVNVNLPASLRHIGDFAFARTGILGHLVIPDSVRYIGWYAFYECDSITALTIGRQVDTIDRTSFLGCRNLQTVYFNADSCHYMGDVTGTNSWYAPFGNDTSLTNLYIGANVKYIPDYSFACYTAYVEYGLRHIYWGDSIQYIGKRAFYNTLLADTIYLPERVEQIGDYAFYNCDSMTAIVIGENVTSIGQQAFGYCDNLRSITLHADTPAQLGSNAFSNTPSNKVFYIPCGTTADYNSSWGYFNYEEPEVDFGVMLNVNDWSMGSVMAVSSRINCVDSSFIIRATPNYHYHFVGWSNGNTANPDTLYLNRDTLVTAFFAPDRYQINVVSNDSVRGTVSGGGEYDYLDTITLSATAVDHYHFVRWSNSWQSYYDNPQQYVVTGNASFTAYFSIDQHQVSVSSNDDMKGVVNGGGTFDYGSPCTLTAIAYTGYQFAGWSNGQTANPYAFPVTGDVELVAMFVEAGAETATVTALSADPTMGTATVNGGSTATVMAGDSVTLVATSNDGFRFVRWNDNSPDSIRTVVVTSDIVYIAYFQSTAVQTYTVTATSSDPTMGVATVNGGSTATVTEGEMVTLVATANDGYRFVRWSDDSTDSTRTVVVTGDMVYIAYFESVSSGMYTVTVSCNDPSMGQAWVNDDSIAVVEPGETVILTAIPGEGYRFVRWNDNNTDNIRAVVVIGDMNFVAYFEVKQNPNAIDDVMADNFMVYQCDEQIVVECDPTDDVMVYDAVGRLLTHVTGTYSSTTAKRQSHSFGLGEEQNSTTRQYRVPVPASGVYLVKVGDHPARRIVVVRM